VKLYSAFEDVGVLRVVRDCGFRTGHFKDIAKLGQE